MQLILRFDVNSPHTIWGTSNVHKWGEYNTSIDPLELPCWNALSRVNKRYKLEIKKLVLKTE